MADTVSLMLAITSDEMPPFIPQLLIAANALVCLAYVLRLKRRTFQRAYAGFTLASIAGIVCPLIGLLVASLNGTAFLLLNALSLAAFIASAQKLLSPLPLAEMTPAAKPRAEGAPPGTGEKPEPATAPASAPPSALGQVRTDPPGAEESTKQPEVAVRKREDKSAALAMLREDARSARLLVSYLERNGLVADKDSPQQVGQDTLAKVIADLWKIEKRLADGTDSGYTQDDEAAFYGRFGKIAAAAYPVTVVSLQDSLRGRDGTPSKVETTIYLQWKYLLASVVSLVLIQAYTTIGYTLNGKVENHYAALTNITSVATNVALPSPPRGEGVRLVNRLVADTNATVTPVALNVAKMDFSGRNRFVLAAGELKTAHASLEAWVRPVSRSLHLAGFSYEADPPRARDAGGAAEAPSAAVVRVTIGTGKPEETMTLSYELPEDFDQTRTQAALLLIFLQTYLLPCLYGWTGAMVYIIRRLTQEATARTFRAGAIHFGTRAWLGIVAGLAIGWFSTPAANSPLAGPAAITQNLGALSLAFLAGYAVEIFFSVLDRLVRAFTIDPPRETPATRP